MTWRCVRCGAPAIEATDAGERPLCPDHLVEEYDTACLRARLRQQVDEDGKISGSPAFQEAVQKHHPVLFAEFRDFFTIK